MADEVSIRLRREVEKLVTNPPPGISCYPSDDTFKTLDAIVEHFRVALHNCQTQNYMLSLINSHNDAISSDQQIRSTITKKDSRICGVKGVPGSPYENGLFKIEIDIPEKYPFDPPRLRFLTKVYHPNIDEGGRVCLDLLKPQPNGTWRPTVMLEGLLVAVQFLLGQPNPDDPLVEEIANEFRYNKSEFERKAKEWTVKYAVKI